MTSIHGRFRCLAATALAAAFLGSASASAFEAHNLIEPPFGSFVGEAGGLAVDQSNGNLYLVNRQNEGAEEVEVKVFGPEGGAPLGGVPSSLTGAGSFEKSFEYLGGVAVDSSCSLRGLSGSECTAFDPSNGDVYILDSGHHVLDKYRLNGSSQYEYVCEFRYYGGGSRCLANGGEESESTEPEGTRLEGGAVAVDPAGDVYVQARIGYSQQGIFEFNAAGESLQAFALPGYYPIFLAASSGGTVYVDVFIEATEGKAVLELKRSSLTGALEGEPTVVPNTAGVRGVAFDYANGQLFVDLGSSGEALNSAHEIVSRFGSGIIANGRALAVGEATGEGGGDVYVVNEAEHDVDRFGPGVVATLPLVDAPPPSLSDVTRTSALLSGTVATGDATTSWHLEHVAAGEYQPAAGNPYAAGGTTSHFKLAPAVGAESVGPLPLTGLLAGTTYHYRLVATNELGTTYGPDHTFTTAPATPPIVTTGAASEVTQTGVTLSGTVGTRELQTSYEFEVGTDTSYGGAKLFGNAGSGGTEAVSVSLRFLIPGTTYHYRLVASNEDGTSYGQDMTFTTPGVPSSIVQPLTAPLIATPAIAFPSEVEVRALTRAQKLANALKACAKKPKSKRAACRRAAQRKYGPVKAKKKSKPKKK